MSDFLKRIKSVFVVEDGASKPAEGQKSEGTAAEKKGSPVVSPAQEVSYKSSPNHISGADPTIADTIFKAIEAQNLDGFDYLEFKESLKALSKLPMDEATMYRSAFATATTMGLTKEKLTSTLSHYLQILDKQKSAFDDALAQQRKENLEKKMAEIAAMDKAIAEKSEQIKRLTQEIEQVQNQQDKMKNELAGISDKIETTKMNFESTFVSIRDQFTSDQQKISEYLK